MQAAAYGLPPAQSLLAITGDKCYVPLRYNATVINSCIKIHNEDQPVCWVRQQGWQVTQHVALNAAPGAVAQLLQVSCSS